MRQNNFFEICASKEAQALRQAIASKQCYCTNEVFLWPSITYQPHQLVLTIVGAKAWKKIPALAEGEKEQYASPGAVTPENLVSIQNTGSERP